MIIHTENQLSLKNFLYKRAKAFGGWFNKAKIEKWTQEYIILVDRTYYVESACRRIRELVESGSLLMRESDKKPKIAFYIVRNKKNGKTK